MVNFEDSTHYLNLWCKHCDVQRMSDGANTSLITDGEIELIINSWDAHIGVALICVETPLSKTVNP